MSTQARLPAAPIGIRQRGQAIIFTAVLIALGVLVAIYTALSSTSVSITNKQTADNAKVLAEAKDALIAWSASRTPPDLGSYARPGELPCPDTDNSGTDPGGCSAGAIGRVPWKSLGIPEPKDSAGETLWYAISGPFRYSITVPITSDTQGNLTVYQDSSATTLTNRAIAILFAPGMPVGNQVRGTTAEKTTASNYLDTHMDSGINNAQTGGPFIQANASSTFNDRVLAITNVDLMPVVEQRVAREMIKYLNAYRAATGVYPWGDLGDGNSNDDEYNFAYNRNRFPCASAKPGSWNDAGISLPNWLKMGCSTVTGWTGVIYYAVARDRLQNSGAGCTTCTASKLSITNSGGYFATQCSNSSTLSCSTQAVSSGNADLLLLTPGAYTGSPTRSWSTSSWSTISGYFEDSNSTVSSENRDNNDDNFYVPTATDNNRVRMYIVR